MSINMDYFYVLRDFANGRIEEDYNKLKSYAELTSTLKDETPDAIYFFKNLSLRYFYCTDTTQTNRIKELVRANLELFKPYIPYDTNFRLTTEDEQGRPGKVYAAGLPLAVRFPLFDTLIRDAAKRRVSGGEFEVTLRDITAEKLNELINQKNLSRTSSGRTINECLSPQLRRLSNPDSSDRIALSREFPENRGDKSPRKSGDTSPRISPRLSQEVITPDT